MRLDSGLALFVGSSSIYSARMIGKRRSSEPPRPSVTIRRKDTRDRALRAAEKLLVRGGYAAISLDRVARAVGVSTPSLYHHFPGGKEELLLAIASRRAIEDSARLIAKMQPESGPFDKLRAAARYFATLPGHHPHHALAESRRQLSAGARQQLQSQFAALIEAPLLQIVETAIAAGEFRRCEPIAIVRAFLMLMLSLDEFEADDPLRAYLPDFILELFSDGVKVHAAAGNLTSRHHAT